MCLVVFAVVVVVVVVVWCRRAVVGLLGLKESSEVHGLLSWSLELVSVTGLLSGGGLLVLNRLVNPCSGP